MNRVVDAGWAEWARAHTLFCLNFIEETCAHTIFTISRIIFGLSHPLWRSFLCPWTFTKKSVFGGKYFCWSKNAYLETFFGTLNFNNQNRWIGKTKKQNISMGPKGTPLVGRLTLQETTVEIKLKKQWLLFKFWWLSNASHKIFYSVFYQVKLFSARSPFW